MNKHNAAVSSRDSQHKRRRGGGLQSSTAAEDSLIDEQETSQTLTDFRQRLDDLDTNASHVLTRLQDTEARTSQILTALMQFAEGVPTPGRKKKDSFEESALLQ